MTNTRTISDVPMWMTEYDRIENLSKDSSDHAFISNLHPSLSDMKSAGWTRVGVATITVELIDPRDLATNKIESLQAQLQKERADSEVRCNRFLDQISKLQAIEYTPETVS